MILQENMIEYELINFEKIKNVKKEKLREWN